MRCPKCGTENGPDSRFCGVCGLPQPALSRLAPTTKIPDDAPFAAPTRQVAPISPVAGVSYSPPSMPPQNVAHNPRGLAQPQQGGLTTRPGGHAAPPRTGDHANVRPSGDHQQVRPSGDHQQVRPSGLAPGRQSFDSITPTARQERTPNPNPPPGPSGPRAQSSMASNPSMSFSSAQHRPLGLIALVLIIDLGLAGAGAFLLAKGLSSPKLETAKKATDQKSELPATAPAAAAAATAPVETAVVAAAPPAATHVPVASAPAAAATATEANAAARTTKTRGATTTSAPEAAGPVTSPSGSGASSPSGVAPVTAVPTTTVQPPSTAAQIDTLANQSAMAFERCRGDQPVAGAITIAFNVQPDGVVSNNAAVENTTGDAELGACLARVVGGWRVSPFQGNTMSFMRPFNYP